MVDSLKFQGMALGGDATQGLGELHEQILCFVPLLFSALLIVSRLISLMHVRASIIFASAYSLIVFRVSDKHTFT